MLLLAVVPPIALGDDAPSAPVLALSALQESVASDAAVEEQLTDPAAAHELPHRDLNREEAVELTEAVFDPFLEAAVGPIQDLEVEKYLGDYAAIVPASEAAEAPVTVNGEPGSTGGDSEPVLLESTLPLRTEGPDGNPEPVDLSLEASGGPIEPSAPLVDVHLPQELGDGIQLPSAGIGIELDGAPAERAPSIVNETVAAYPNVATDTDFSVVPTPTGVETLTTLRSADAPRIQTLSLDLPAGATLRQSSLGGAEVEIDGETALNIPPAAAIDANGAGVPVDMTISGDSLVLTASPDADTAYPVMVDPLFEAYDWYYFNSQQGQDTWHSYTNASGMETSSIAGALFLHARAEGFTYSYGSQANWMYYVPRLKAEEAQGRLPTSYLQRMTLWHMGFVTEPGGPYSPYLVAGILGAGGWVGKPGGYSVWTYWGNSAPFYTNAPGNGVLVDFENGEPGKRDTSAKLGDVALASLEGISIPNRRIASVGAAAVYIGDEDLPKTANGKIVGWVNQTATAPITAEAEDTGLGVKKISFEIPGQGTKAATNPCLGTTSNPCPRLWTGSIAAAEYKPSEMPQGFDWIPLTAEDTLGNKSVAGEKALVKVDHTKPKLTLSGTITEQGKLGTTLPQYTVKYVATDGAEGAPQSGVVSTEVKIDGKAVEAKYAPGCSTNSCSITKEWTLSATAYAVGSHTVEVIATDGVGLATTEKVTISLAKDSTAPQLTATTALYTAPEGWVEQKAYGSEASAKDPSGYGITSLVLKIDGTAVKTVTGTCPTGGCTKSLGLSTLNMASYKGGKHLAELIATDGAGNVTKKTWTINVDPKGGITAGEANDTLEAVEETEPETMAVAPASDVVPPEERAEGADPGLEQVGANEFASVGTPVDSTIITGSNEAMIVNAPGGEEVEISSVAPPTTSEPIVIEDVAAVLPNTAKGTDTIVRPKYNGLLNFQTIREPSSPESYSWEIALQPGQTLKPLEGETFAGVFFEDGTQMMLIEAMPAHDALGKAVPTKLAVMAPNIVTLTVAHTKGTYVYPVMTGPSFEVGFSRVEVVWPSPEEELSGPEGEFEGYTVVSPPEPISTEGEASASGRKQLFFKHVLCSHDPKFAEIGLRLGSGLSEVEEHCGDPWKGGDGIFVFFREGIHGRFTQREPDSKKYALVRHEGGTEDDIGCVAEASSTPPHGTQRRAHKGPCEWYPAKTRDSVPNNAVWGEHITPYGQMIGESRGSCGDECNGTPNPWRAIAMPPMAFYLWADGHYKYHQTDCIDCD